MSYRIEEYRGIRSYGDLPGDLIPGIEACIQSAFNGNITEEDARAHLTGDQILIARSTAQDIVLGFSSTSICSPADQFPDSELASDLVERGAYFAGAAIRDTAQGTGLYHQLNKHRLALLDEHGLKMVFTRTQNPRVAEGITHSIDQLVADQRCSRYEIGRIICRGAYGRMLTAVVPSARTTSFDDLDYANGDAAILIWRLQS